MTGKPKAPEPGTQRIHFYVDMTPEELHYFRACARIRDVCVTSLTRRLWRTVLRDQLVASILDDETDLRKRARGEHRYRATAADAPL